jgi:hypothetical protein
MGLLQSTLHALIVAVGDLDGDADRNVAGLHGAQQSVLAVFEQPDDVADVLEAEAGLLGDLFRAISPLLQPLNVPEELYSAVLSPGEVLHEAHHQAVLTAGLDDDGRDLALAKLPEGLKATLAAHEIVPGTLRAALDAAEIGPMQAALEAELLLRPALLLPCRRSRRRRSGAARHTARRGEGAQNALAIGPPCPE